MRIGRRLPIILLFSALLAVLVLSIPHASLAQTTGFKILPDCAAQRYAGPGKEVPPPPSLSCALQVFINFAQIILGLTGSLALLMFVWAGYMMLTAAGNEQRVTKGKEILKTALIGIAIVFLAGTVIRYGLGSLVKDNLVIGQSCQNGQGTVVQKIDGTLACATTCSSVGEGYECVATSQAAEKYCFVGGGLCPSSDETCCATGGSGTSGSGGPSVDQLLNQGPAAGVPSCSQCDSDPNPAECRRLFCS